ncbi:splicing factor-like protein 1 [Zingiber officinale]|uniref:splicing factor-like protein 1 n=1 Tax=Zingiber officinale TaxID=94328 RepID=UPI001C4B07D9|nr:splicing factor-like protein 1 [Zingiber officinale]XP_042384749.1 splicing factor-like protein 1 [Zingiber officinale]
MGSQIGTDDGNLYIDTETDEKNESDKEEGMEDEHIELHIEDYDQERFEPKTSAEGADEKHKMGSNLSFSKKRIRSMDNTLDNLEKMQKLNEESHLEMLSYEKGNRGSYDNERHSRWDKDYDVLLDNHPAAKVKRRKTRWSNEDLVSRSLDLLNFTNFVKVFAGATSADPEIEELNSQLLEINQKLNDLVPVNNLLLPKDLDKQMLQSKSKVWKKLIKSRQLIISRLIKKNPTFSFLSKKFNKKIYIPEKEYPDYNFLGLLIGPMGSTRKKMEMETGAKISMRGKGSVREGRASRYNEIRTEADKDEDLHVYIEAHTELSLNAAVKIVEKLLVPVEDSKNEQKMDNLRLLAEMKDKRRIDGKDQKTTHLCDICGQAGHSTTSCPLSASNPGTSKSENFLGDAGCIGVPPFIHPPIPSSIPILIGNQQSNALACSDNKPSEENGLSNLFVGYLPHSVNEDKLIELFLPFGCISKATVIKDKTTGLSKGYGFVHYTDPACAAAAMTRMNGYRINGKSLSVRVAVGPSNTNTSVLPEVNTNFNKLLDNPITASSQGGPSAASWIAPLGSLLPKCHASCSPKSSYRSHANLPSYPAATISQCVSSVIRTDPTVSVLPKSHASLPLKTNFPSYADLLSYSTTAISQGQTVVMRSVGPPVSISPRSHVSFPPKHSFIPNVNLLSYPIATISQEKLDPLNTQGPPASMFPETNASLPLKINFLSKVDVPSYPPAAISQGEPSVINWPDLPGSMREVHTIFPSKKTVLHHNTMF